MLGPMPSDNEVRPGMLGRDYGDVLWQPGPEVIERARITSYARWLASERGVVLPGGSGPAAYRDLHHWSVTKPGPFWDSLWDYFGVAGERGDGPVLTGTTMPDVTWFPGATLNYAQNALRTAATDPARIAVIARDEAGNQSTLSYGELAAEVARVAAGLKALGVTTGDRVAAYLPNIPAAIIGLLATASIGAIWSSCSPDFGPASVIDRFAQITPKVLFAVETYRYGGKQFDRGKAVADIAAALPGLAAVITVGARSEDTGPALLARGSDPPEPLDGPWPRSSVTGPRPQTLAFDSLPGAPATALEFEAVSYGHPLWVLYSSGTTGLPKAIVHSHGGIVQEHLKALCLHQDLGAGDVFFWYTTTGWMMWSFLAGGLLAGVAIVAYDGSATYPGTGALWQMAAEVGVTYFGTGAPYLLACAKAGLAAGREYDLSRVRGIGSTGSPLPPEGFRWVYRRVGSDLLLGSYSGGTDLCTGFVGPSPLLPVRAGVIAASCLGAGVEAFGPDGTPVTGQVGELVLTAPMPSMPVAFWNDPGGERYRASYFTPWPGVWRHGDWITMLADGGCVIFGRSDATLNRGGVRMGTSEFYRVVEQLPEVADSLVVDTGQLGADGRLILYLVLTGDLTLDEDLASRIKAALRAALSPRHVPDEIYQVPGIPRTLSGKKLEVPVRKILLGTPVADAADPDALANPEVLAWFSK